MSDAIFCLPPRRRRREFSPSLTGQSLAHPTTFPNKQRLSSRRYSATPKAARTLRTRGGPPPRCLAARLHWKFHHAWQRPDSAETRTTPRWATRRTPPASNDLATTSAKKQQSPTRIPTRASLAARLRVGARGPSPAREPTRPALAALLVFLVHLRNFPLPTFPLLLFAVRRPPFSSRASLVPAVHPRKFFFRHRRHKSVALPGGKEPDGMIGAG